MFARTRRQAAFPRHRRTRRMQSRFLLASALAVGAFALCAATAPAQIRVATYNIAADVNGVTTANPGFDTVVEGIGSETVNGFARPFDILGLQEVTSNSATVAPIVTTLNNFY